MSSGILVLSWLLSVGTVQDNIGLLSGSQRAYYQTAENTYSTTLAFEALLLEHVFIGAKVTTWETPAGDIYFYPAQSLYVFSAGLRFGALELGFRHECDHVTLPGFDLPAQGFDGQRTEVYVSVSGKFSIF